jgi:hypothetical protein
VTNLKGLLRKKQVSAPVQFQALTYHSLTQFSNFRDELKRITSNMTDKKPDAVEAAGDNGGVDLADADDDSVISVHTVYDLTGSDSDSDYVSVVDLTDDVIDLTGSDDELDFLNEADEVEIAVIDQADSDNESTDGQYYNISI